jgi:hypothetical protein
MAELDPDGRVTAMVAVCTPFAGSVYARRLPSRVLRELAPGSPTTRRLQAYREVDARITTVSGVFDPHIPGGSTLPGARNVVLDDGGHFRLLGVRAVHDIVIDVAGR